MTPHVEVNPNSVIIQGVTIERQASCSPSQWMDFWRPLNLDHQEALEETRGRSAPHY